MKTAQILLLSIASLLMLAGCGKKGGENTADAQEGLTIEIATGLSMHFTELGLACHDGDLSQVQTLIQNGARTSSCMCNEVSCYDALYVAVQFGKLNILDYLIQQGEDVKTVYDESGGTLLSLACLYEDKAVALKMVERLIKAGASVQAERNFDDGYTAVPLHFAIGKNNLPLVKLLVEHGADIHIESESMTIFQMADWDYLDTEMKEYIRSLRN
jgi:ankyrin repeat protein